ncbi:hypothetical protein EAX61_16255 [Dokdonia sinensis]|uniref:DoxX family protein n=1 Tax=Dokdonia sinensis TaxID=2479847 RepID=A0A3M0GFF8_9FLAO|nr:hypothetical protein [Dokdonia sinensis]RMB56046.1 hypothetical protein EAX61_16255 [Dokdonia sinensis]
MTNQVVNKRSKFRFIWIIPILLLIATAIPKIIGLEFMVENMTNIGLGHMIFSVGIIELLCAVVFLIPQSRKIGFFLCVAYIGGIITAQWTTGSFNLGVIMQILLWVGMYFEDKELFRLRTGVKF